MKHAWWIFPAILIAGCSRAVPATGLTPTPEYRVEIQADAGGIRVGRSVSVTGTFVGGYGNPAYYVKVEDATGAPSELWVTLLPGNAVHEKRGASAVLTLTSTSTAADRVAAVFRAAAPGAADVSFGINGEIPETDGSGRWYWNYITKFSERMRITVYDDAPT